MSEPDGPLSVLYRRDNRWRAYATCEMDRVDSLVSACSVATASPWIWWGPTAVAQWMLRTGKSPAEVPATVRARAISSLRPDLDRALRAVDNLVKILGWLEESPAKRGSRREPEFRALLALARSHQSPRSISVFRGLLAGEFEVAPSTVERWARGVARPDPKTQARVVAWLRGKYGKTDWWPR